WAQSCPACVCRREVLSKSLPVVRACSSHRWGRPLSQEWQCPQLGTKLRITRSPGLTMLTPPPTACTVPAPRWPRPAGRAARPSLGSSWTRTRRFSRAEYDRLIELGVFQSDEHIERIGGELMVAEPKGAPHYTAVVKTAGALEAAFGPGWYVRREGPVGLDDD